MKKHFLQKAAAILFLFAAMACSDRPRTVEYPLISAANTRDLDISSVNLNDSTTVLDFDVHYMPGYWIRIASDSRLEADGKTYALIAADGIELDKEFYVPESGEAQFQLTFEPLPLSTKKFDFIEGDADGAFKLWDIDLTRHTHPSFPDGLPSQLKKESLATELPEPLFEIGETTLNIHLLNNRPGLAKDGTVFVNTLYGSQESQPFKVDSLGNATITFDQYGTGQFFVVFDELRLGFPTMWIDPGENINIYIDMNRSGALAMSHRDNADLGNKHWIFTDGKHSDLTRTLKHGKYNNFSFNLFNGNFADYHMTGDQYFDMVVSKYQANSDSIAASAMPDIVKQYAQLTLDNDFIQAIADYRYFLGHNYRHVHNAWRERNIPLDSIPAVLTDDHYRRAVEIVDPSDKRLLLANSEALAIMDWTPYGASNDLSKSVKMMQKAASKAVALTLTDSDLDSLSSLSNPFYAAACDSMMNRASRLAEKLKKDKLIQPTPDVPVKQIFDAIVAPHLGKVVVVDLWNTWCGPCKMALKANEPLKSDQLADDDIVWIYIADESSPLATYLGMLPDISGLHYRLTEEQKKEISTRFNVDGIPYYILVDRKGNAVGRPDIRDHNLYIKTIKEELNK